VRVASNLPLELTTFIGRECELSELRQLVGSVRLLTLVGAGGIGKTRLALQLAHELEQRPLDDGVWLVELAAVRDPTLVPHTVAAVLDIRERPDQPVSLTLRESLRTASPAIVVDNCEHVIEACAELVEDLLRTCPGLRIIATSRRPLRVPGEVTWRVPPLRVAAAPPSGAIGSDEIAASEAVRLFIERTRSVLPNFVLNDRNAAGVAQICRHLDGIPLALELAAARMSALGVEQLVNRLNDRFRLLATPSHAPNRGIVRSAPPSSGAMTC
jgi:predicted ATPase